MTKILILRATCRDDNYTRGYPPLIWRVRGIKSRGRAGDGEQFFISGSDSRWGGNIDPHPEPP